METEARTHYRSLDLRSSVERRAMVAVGRSMKRAILTTALLLALPAGVAAQSAPDLEVAFAEVDDSTPVEGGRFTLWVTVGNFGDAESAATTLRYYQSTDATISSADMQVGTAAVGAVGANRISQESITLTAPSTAGTYYYGACVDAVAGESDVTDNCTRRSVTVEVVATTIGSDLYMHGPNRDDSTREPGETYWILVTVQNLGTEWSTATTVRFYRSTDGTITTSDTEVGTEPVGPLRPLAGSGRAIPLTAPSAAGTYYYGACVDAVAGESDLTNNCSSVTMAVTVTTPPPPPPPTPPPPPPVVARVTETSTTSLTVSWTAPTANGTPFTGYDLRYRQGSTGEFMEGPQDVTGTSATIEGLIPGTEYEVQVRSSGSSGDSEWVALSTVRTNAPPPPPVAPAVTETSSSRLTVSWTAPTTEGDPITGYDLRYRVGSDGDWTDGPQDVTNTSAAIEGLDPDTEYEVQVRTKSAAGDGEWTALGMVRTEILVLYDLFSLSLDLDSSDRDQYVSMLNVSPGGVVPIQVFGADIRGTRSLDLRVG